MLGRGEQRLRALHLTSSIYPFSRLTPMDHRRMTSKRIQRQICAAQAGTFCRLCSLFCPKTQDVSADHKRPTEIGPPEFLAKMQLVVPAPSLSYRRTGPPAVWSRAASTASQGFASRTLSSYALSDLLCLQFFSCSQTNSRQALRA